MPGILGIAGRVDVAVQTRLSKLARMEDLLNTSARCVKDPVFNDALVSARRVHNCIIEPIPQPCSQGGFMSGWMANSSIKISSVMVWEVRALRPPEFYWRNMSRHAILAFSAKLMGFSLPSSMKRIDNGFI